MLHVPAGYLCAEETMVLMLMTCDYALHATMHEQAENQDVSSTLQRMLVME